MSDSAVEPLNESLISGRASRRLPLKSLGVWLVACADGSGDVYVGRQRVANRDGLFFSGHNTLEVTCYKLQVSSYKLQVTS